MSEFRIEEPLTGTTLGTVEQTTEQPPVETPVEPAPEPNNPACLFTIPSNLHHLTKLAAKDASRYAMTGVQIERTEDPVEGTGYIAVATNGKQLAVVRGSCPVSATEYPAMPTMHGAPNGAVKAMIPTAALVKACKEAPTRTYSGERANINNTVAVVLGEQVATLGSTTLEDSTVKQTRLVEGRFPCWRDVFPKKEPVVRVNLNADMLAELLKVASEFSPDGDGRVIIEVFDGLSPVKITTKHDGQTFEGLIMPLS